MTSSALPAWMYRDPAEVAEQIEERAIARARAAALKRQAEREATERGLGPLTVRAMRRLRIQGLLKQAIGDQQWSDGR
jgi:hypothetical protein